jgi:hypothetical protein
MWRAPEFVWNDWGNSRWYPGDISTSAMQAWANLRDHPDEMSLDSGEDLYYVLLDYDSI